MKPRTKAELAQAKAMYIAKLAEWAKIPTRQEFADEAHMRGYLSRAGFKAPPACEPASVPRLRQLLRRAGITGVAFLGVLADGRQLGLAGYLERNPALPLWAAVALCLELAGEPRHAP